MRSKLKPLASPFCNNYFTAVVSNLHRHILLLFMPEPAWFFFPFHRLCTESCGHMFTISFLLGHPRAFGGIAPRKGSNRSKCLSNWSCVKGLSTLFQWQARSATKQSTFGSWSLSFSNSPPPKENSNCTSWTRMREDHRDGRQWDYGQRTGTHSMGFIYGSDWQAKSERKEHSTHKEWCSYLYWPKGPQQSTQETMVSSGYSREGC